MSTVPVPMKLAKDLAAIVMLAEGRTAKRRLNELLTLIRDAERAPQLPGTEITEGRPGGSPPGTSS